MYTKSLCIGQRFENVKPREVFQLRFVCEQKHYLKSYFVTSCFFFVSSNSAVLFQSLSDIRRIHQDLEAKVFSPEE